MVEIFKLEIFKFLKHKNLKLTFVITALTILLIATAEFLVAHEYLAQSLYKNNPKIMVSIAFMMNKNTTYLSHLQCYFAYLFPIFVGVMLNGVIYDDFKNKTIKHTTVYSNSIEIFIIRVIIFTLAIIILLIFTWILSYVMNKIYLGYIGEGSRTLISTVNIYNNGNSIFQVMILIMFFSQLVYIFMYLMIYIFENNILGVISLGASVYKPVLGFIVTTSYASELSKLIYINNPQSLTLPSSMSLNGLVSLEIINRNNWKLLIIFLVFISCSCFYTIIHKRIK